METQLPPLFDYRQPAPLFFVVLLHVAAMWFFQSGLHKPVPVSPPVKEVTVAYLVSPKPQPVPVDTPPAPVMPPEPVTPPEPVKPPPPPETVRPEPEPPKPVTPKKKPAKKTSPKKAKPKRPPETPKPVSTTPSETAIAVPQDDAPGEEAPAPIFEPLPAPAQPVAAPAPPAPPPPPAPVEAPRFDAAYLNNPPPSYPPLSRRMSEEGRVVLRVRVGVSGNSQDIRIHSSSGFPRLDDAARVAVRGWRFLPAMQGGKAVSAWVLVPLNFSLDQ
jgi:protein TonB